MLGLCSLCLRRNVAARCTACCPSELVLCAIQASQLCGAQLPPDLCEDPCVVLVILPAKKSV